MIFSFGDAMLSQGSSGGDVRTLQTILNQVGANGGGLTVDGVFGAATKAALIAFQKAYGLTANGTADAATWSKLREASGSESAGDVQGTSDSTPITGVWSAGTEQKAGSSHVATDAEMAAADRKRTLLGVVGVVGAAGLLGFVAFGGKKSGKRRKRR